VVRVPFQGPWVKFPFLLKQIGTLDPGWGIQPLRVGGKLSGKQQFSSPAKREITTRWVLGFFCGNHLPRGEPLIFTCPRCTIIYEIFT